MIHIIKRDGTEADFDANKITNAITKANNEVEPIHQLSDVQIKAATNIVADQVKQSKYAMSVEDIQELVEKAIMEMRGFETAQHYIRYRYKKNLVRASNTLDNTILTLIDLQNEEIKQENSNKNPVINSTQRDYMAGEVSKDISRRLLLDKDIIEAHDKGIIHFHDMDYYAQKEHNCCLINLKDMLENGTCISGTKIDTPHSFYTACNITTQIVAQVASSQYGGQTWSLAHLIPFVEVSRQKLRKAVKEEFNIANINIDENKINAIAESRLKTEIKSGVQTLQYQLITLMTCNGQAPFVSVFIWIDEVPEEQRADMIMVAEEMLKQRIQGIKNPQGVWVTPAFPKILYTLDDDNCMPGTKYWDLTVLAAECTAKRMVPDYISAKKMREYKNGDVYPCMGCRSFLTPDITGFGPDGSHKYYGRFNQGVVTINLPYIACLSNGDMDKFWNILEDYLELCHRALRSRHDRLMGTVSDVAPIMWQDGALARLEKGQVIDELLLNNYSTISLGFAGVYEMTQRMLHVSHTDPKGREFALSVMQKLNDKCAEWRANESIGYSVYGTPIESTTYKFAKALQKDFGIIPEVSDHTYITNCYHINVREEIDAFSKLAQEAEFQRLAPGGAISYIESPNLQDNIEAVLKVIEFIYDNIMYAEINTKSDYCCECGYDGEIQIVTDNYGKLVWECPKCGNRNQNKMSVARRTCGLTN